MIATIDGKILSGGRDESVHDLGSKHDKLMMKRIEASADAVLLGAQTLRATPLSWSPQTVRRYVVTRSGDVPEGHRYLTEGSATILSGEVDWLRALQGMRDQGVDRLLVMGGSLVNAQLFALGLVDEIFLTVAPKIRLGGDIPTIADGEALPRESIQEFSLVEHHAVGSELFLRYRREGADLRLNSEATA